MSPKMDAENSSQLVADAHRFVERIRRYLEDSKILGTEGED